jgi:hypothetical protein
MRAGQLKARFDMRLRLSSLKGRRRLAGMQIRMLLLGSKTAMEASGEGCSE